MLLFCALCSGFLFHHRLSFPAASLYLCVIVPAYPELFCHSTLPRMFTSSHTIDFGIYGGNRASYTPIAIWWWWKCPPTSQSEDGSLYTGRWGDECGPVCHLRWFLHFCWSVVEGFAADARGRKRALLKGNLFPLSVCWLKTDDGWLVVYRAGSGAVFLWGSWGFSVPEATSSCGIEEPNYLFFILHVTSWFSQPCVCDRLTFLSSSTPRPSSSGPL